MPAKWPFFLDFANSRLPLTKYPLFCENGYERGIRLGREWRGRELVKGESHLGQLTLWLVASSMRRKYFLVTTNKLQIWSVWIVVVCICLGCNLLEIKLPTCLPKSSIHEVTFVVMIKCSIDIASLQNLTGNILRQLSLRRIPFNTRNTSLLHLLHYSADPMINLSTESTASELYFRYNMQLSKHRFTNSPTDVSTFVNGSHSVTVVS